MSKVIKEKMEKLDTLSGGIVFGKEEAWERLQAKLDKKPARKIALIYKIGVAAAAMLVLAVCITALNNTQEKKIAAAPALYQNETTQPTPSTPDVKNNAAGVVTEQAKEIHTAKLTRRMPAMPGFAVPAVTTPEPSIATPDVATPDLLSNAPVTVVSAVPKPPMRVVHINELNNEEPSTKPTYAGSSVDIKNMKVVSLNEDATIQPQAEIVRSNKPRGTLPFFIAPAGNTATSEKDVAIAHNPFNIKLNIQN